MGELKFDRKEVAIVVTQSEATLANIVWNTLSKMHWFEFYPHRMETAIRIMSTHPLFYTTTPLRAKKLIIDIMARHIKKLTPNLLKGFMQEFDEVIDEDFMLREITTTAHREYDYRYFCVNWNALWTLVGGNGGKIKFKRK